MNDNSVYQFIKELVNNRILNKKYPAHVLLLHAQNEAKDKFIDYEKEKFLNILRKLLISKKIYSGKTVNGNWISINNDNINLKQYQ